MRSKIIRIAFWAMVLSALLGGIAYSLRPQPILVDIEPASRGPLQVMVVDDGVTRIRERYVVSTPLAGRLLRVTYDVGDSVVAGESVLARMQPTDPELLDPRAVAQAQARVSAAEKRLQATKAELAKAEAAVTFAEEELGRIRRLAQGNAASASELQQAEFQFRARTEEARAADYNVDIAEYELQLQRAALLLTTPELETPPADADPSENETPAASREAAINGATTVAPGEMELAILSPITGRVLRLYQESSAVLAAGAELMELGDPNDLEIVVDALSQDAVRIDPGDEVLLDNWGGDWGLAGRVSRVEPAGFTKVSALGVEEQRVNIIIDLNDPVERRGALGDNFRVDARIVVWKEDDVLRIPSSALFRVGDQWNVFQVVDGVARQVSIHIGANNGEQAQVLKGLSEHDQVIVHPGDDVADGSRVTLR